MSLDAPVTARPVRRLDWLAAFAAILAVFAVLMAASLPEVLSLDLWVFKDRSSLLNLDYLLDQGLRPGVDYYYSYGLLPLLVQRVLFALFGRGFWPLIGFDAVYAVLTALGWALLLRSVGLSRVWLLAVLALAPILLWVNPNLPYCLVLLSILFALVLVLRGRTDWALAAAAVGCVSVPSLPLVLVALLLAAVAVEWWGSARTPAALVRLLLPGFVAYVVLAALLAAVFGLSSMLATATPLAGMALYKAANYSLFASGMEFLHPAGAGLGYTLQSRAAWFVFGTALLWALGVLALGVMLRWRRLVPGAVAVVLCAGLQAFFVLAAFGSPGQHVIYDPLVVAGVVLGLATLPVGRMRMPLLAGFVLLGVCGQILQVRGLVWMWRHTGPVDDPASLYASPEWNAEWSRVRALAPGRRLLLLSYATGVHHYYSDVDSPALWFLQVGQVPLADEVRLIGQIGAAGVVVEDLTGPTDFIDHSEGVQQALSAMCLTAMMPDFWVWMRDPPGGTRCQAARR